MGHTKRILASTMAMATLAALACAPAANAAAPYDITVHAGDNNNTLKGRTLTAYRLAYYVDGTYVSIGDKDKDGVAVHTEDGLKASLDKVLAKTTGVADVTNLPGWPDSGRDPIAWMGGFRQNTGNNQSAGTFGFGWNESGPQKIGVNSPDKAYVGTVREFADNIMKDPAALNAVKAQLTDAQVKAGTNTVTCQAGATCTVPITTGSGIYLILDTGGQTTWNGALDNMNGTWHVGSSQPMIVPTRPDTADLAGGGKQIDGKTNDTTKLGTTGTLGEITIKNVDDQEVLPPGNPPKKRDESTAAGKDAADNASDVGDTVPYVVHYRVPDLSAYKAALDNGDPWIYTYTIADQTTKGLKITGAPTATITDTTGKTVSIPLTQESANPGVAADVHASKTGQTNEPVDAGYYLEQQDKDASHLVINIGKWLVKNYGDIAANDKTKTLYGHQVEIKYNAQVTREAVWNNNMVNNRNHLIYSNQPDSVASGKTVTTPDVIVKQWTYDIDLHKRNLSSKEGLNGVDFKLTVKDNGNQSDSKANGSAVKFVRVADGDYRQAMPNEQSVTTVTTGPDGLLRLRGLDLGVYTLTETKARDGYRPLKSSEDITIAAQYSDDKSNYITPDHQTEASETITQNNKFLTVPMFALNGATNASTGLTVTKTTTAQTAKWSGQDKSGKYYADDKTNWVDAVLTLYNQPINVMLAKTGGTVLFGTAMAAGLVLLAVGAAIVSRRRRA